MRKHNDYPENILVYRDGVYEGQYQLVLDNEYKDMRKACEDTYPKADTGRKLPRIMIVIVGKRHHTRFFPRSADEGDLIGNCKPGTMVDRGITDEGAWDCYLLSHAANQDTARPAHYVVIVDEIFRAWARAQNNLAAGQGQQPSERAAADELEKITHALCYVYGRASKAVSICTPTYYADLLCDRARRHRAEAFEGKGGGGSSNAAAAGEDAGVMRSGVVDRLENTMYYI